MLPDQVNYQQYIQNLANQSHKDELALFIQSGCELLWGFVCLKERGDYKKREVLV